LSRYNHTGGGIPNLIRRERHTNPLPMSGLAAHTLKKKNGSVIWEEDRRGCGKAEIKIGGGVYPINVRKNKMQRGGCFKLQELK